MTKIPLADKHFLHPNLFRRPLHVVHLIMLRNRLQSRAELSEQVWRGLAPAEDQYLAPGDEGDAWNHLLPGARFRCWKRGSEAAAEREEEKGRQDERVRW